MEVTGLLQPMESLAVIRDKKKRKKNLRNCIGELQITEAR